MNKREIEVNKISESQCSYINPDGSRCGAHRMKSSVMKYCVGHSRSVGEELTMFGGSLVEQIESGLFRPLFENAEGSIKSWEPWLAILSGMFGLPMSPERETLFRKLSGDREPPKEQVKEAWLVFSRRTGKSWVTSCLGIYLALFRKYPQLRKGERGWVCIISPTRDMSRTIMDYSKTVLETVPKFKDQIEKVLRDEILLKNGTGIAVFTANSMSVRSRTVIAGVLEESAFFPRDESVNPDVEVLNALIPATMTIPNSMIIGISSPYSRDGLLYSMYEKYFGINEEKLLVCNGATIDLNPLVSKEWIDSELERDYEKGKAEFLGLWRDDVSQFFDGELLNISVDLNRGNLEPRTGIENVAFTDGASGSSSKNADSFCLAIGHKENNQVIIDAVFERRPPFSPASVVEEFSNILRQWNIHRVQGDRWAVGALGDLFRQNRIMYQESKLTASDLYMESATFFHSGQVRLPDNKRLLQQLRGLERHVRKSGRDQVTHGPGGHDDLANVVCGVICDVLLGLHLSADSPEMLAMLPQTSKAKDSLQKLPPWKLRQKVEAGEVHVIDHNGKKHYMRVSITNKLKEKV